MHSNILAFPGWLTVWFLFVLVLPLSADAQDNKIKNVLFIIADDLKASVLGCYGDPICKTPHIDSIAKRGMLFEKAYCNATWCAPSRQSFMHSRYTNSKLVNGKNPVNLGQHFRNQGMYSGRVGKIYHMRVPGDIIDGTDGQDIASSWTERFNTQGQEAHTPGDYACLNLNIFTDELEGRQSTRMPHRMFVTVQQDGDGSDQPDYKAADKAIEILNQRKDEPFFLAVGLVRPHYPNVAPRKYFEMYPWEDIKLPPNPTNDLADIPKLGLGQTLAGKNPIGQYPDNQKRMWAGYYATVTFMDDQVGRILAELDRLGLRESTAVVFTSDHGYHLGEHTFWQKLNLHEEVARVPLVVSAPGFSTGRTQALAELVDLFPTFSELVGAEPPETVQGLSLLPVLKDANAKVRDAALCFHRGYLLRDKDWAYMKYKDESEELYNMNSDPKQFSNLAQGDKVRREQLIKMRAQLSAKLDKLGLNVKNKKTN